MVCFQTLPKTEDTRDRNEEVIQRIQQLMVDMASEKEGSTFESSMKSIGSNFEGMDQMMGMLQPSSSSSVDRPRAGRHMCAQ